MNATFTGNGFQKDGDHIRTVGGDGADGVQIVIGCAQKTRYQRFKAGLYFAVTGCGQGRQRAAVETAFGNDHLRCVDTFLVTIEPREFERRFIGFCTGVAKEYAFHTGDIAQCIGKFFLLARYGRDWTYVTADWIVRR